MTRRFTIWVLVSIFTIGPVPVAFMVTAGDQWLQNIVDNWMSDPDIYKSLSLEPNEYLDLPLHWRQALAEFSVQPATAELAEVREPMSTLTTQQIELVDQIAPYVIDGFLVRDLDKPSNHPIPGLSLVDFATLEDMGLLQNVQRGYSMRNTLLNFPFVLPGTTATLKILDSGREIRVSLPVTRLTELGITLVGLLRVPSDIRYFEWIAKEIDQEGVDVGVWATGANIDNSGKIQRETVLYWPNDDGT